MSLLTIQAALDAKLQTLTGIGDIVLEGVPYTPQRNRPYVCSRMAAYSEAAGGVGSNAVLLSNGSYQINVMRPATEGTTGARQVAALLTAAFARKVAITTTDSLSVSLLSASKMPSIDAGDWQTVPVVVTWFSSRNPS